MFDHQMIWQSYTPFHSSANVQEFLFRIYNRNNIEDAEKKSYNNCYPFIYYIDHGKSYYLLSEQAPISIKPVLLFYGMTQLVKACLLTVDPEYPESTSVLAHGVSTRKRKKQSYDFLKDEVKIQKNGLFSHFAEKMFHVEHLDGEKLTMLSLLKRIPELSSLFNFSYQEDVSFPLIKTSEHTYILKYNIIDKYHMTEERFKDFLNDSLKKTSLIEFDKDNKNIVISFKDKNHLTPISCHPFYFNHQVGNYVISSERELTSYFPEMMIHYLILYNLSMISRYETEWWSELLQHISTKDLPFIQQFIQTTTFKIPYLISEFLHGLNK
ncbi:YaaC family protein [Bacillus suaedaesalsae]|uniref:YaaC family protein n=1 Tax=Bacillus suaedaesalsae TaxID=2810349 RepID=A0ABS2DF66_9BACI|nr:YaaC family protein [Bacillus suaedaesalsae]MBM6616665.1 YaaC family protein [Bacillus suaedaesalsae]